MRPILTLAFLGISLALTSFNSHAQSIQPPADKFESYIQEVYSNTGKDFIKPESRRYAYFKELYLNRLTFVKNDADKLKRDTSLPKLSSVPLYDTYNKGLMRDALVDPLLFNPFKYNLDFYSQKKLVYWIDNSDYLLVIIPQERN